MTEVTHRMSLNYGYAWLRTEALEGYAYATAILTEIDRLKADLARIPRYTVSKHGTHYWTGRRWREQASIAERGASRRRGRQAR